VVEDIFLGYLERVKGEPYLVEMENLKGWESYS